MALYQGYLRRRLGPILLLLTQLRPPALQDSVAAQAAEVGLAFSACCSSSHPALLMHGRDHLHTSRLAQRTPAGKDHQHEKSSKPHPHPKHPATPNNTT